jgi:hypothetical protein
MMHLLVQRRISRVRHEANLDPRLDNFFLREAKVKRAKYQGIPREAVNNIT